MPVRLRADDTWPASSSHPPHLPQKKGKKRSERRHIVDLQSVASSSPMLCTSITPCGRPPGCQTPGIPFRRAMPTMIASSCVRGQFGRDLLQNRIKISAASTSLENPPGHPQDPSSPHEPRDTFLILLKRPKEQVTIGAPCPLYILAQVWGSGPFPSSALTDACCWASPSPHVPAVISGPSPSSPFLHLHPICLPFLAQFSPQAPPNPR